MNTDRWYYRVFQNTPDLIRSLLPTTSAALGLDPDDPGDRFYRFEALEIQPQASAKQQELSHRLDGVLWPRDHERGSAEQPVVLLEVQMYPDVEFHARLSAQSLRFVQRHPRVEHLEVVVITPHQRLKLGPSNPPRLLRAVLDEVHWISLEELSCQPDLDPLLNLLTLPIRPEADLQSNSRQILARRPDLSTIVLTMLGQRFPLLTEDQLMQIAEIPREDMRHTRLVQDWLAEGRAEGEARGRQTEAAAMTLRLLNRRCGPLSPSTTNRIQALPLEQLEALADALLDFQDHEDLTVWLETN